MSSTASPTVAEWRWLAVLLLGLLLPCLAQARLPAGVSGTWFNPQQSGHGLTVDMLEDGRALVFWHAFDPDGRPLNLYIEARAEQDRLVGDAYATEGMRFGSFDPATLRIQRWGRIEIRFASCRGATLQYVADGPAGGPGYGEGTIALERLSRIAGLPCRFDGDAALAVGTYEGQVNYPSAPRERRIRAAVAPDGTLWGIELLEPDSTALPHGTYMGNWGPPTLVFTGSSIDAAAGAVTVLLRADGNLWLLGRTPPPQPPIRELHFEVDGPRAVGPAVAYRWVDRAITAELLRTPLQQTLAQPTDLQRIAGNYRLRLRGQFSGLDYDMLLEASSDGRLCVRAPGRPPGDCDLTGSLGIAFAGYAFVDFELRSRDSDVYRGRGWLTPDGAQLLLVGRSDATDTGLGIIGIRE
jgi:hypothetical protein